MWTPAHLPGGCVHINLPHVVPVAKKLGIDYAEAMTGFDIRQGRSIPNFEGIVICVEHEAELHEAYVKAERVRLALLQAKSNRVVMRRWKTLIQGVLNKHKKSMVFEVNVFDRLLASSMTYSVLQRLQSKYSEQAQSSQVTVDTNASNEDDTAKKQKKGRNKKEKQAKSAESIPEIPIVDVDLDDDFEVPAPSPSPTPPQSTRKGRSRSTKS